VSLPPVRIPSCPCTFLLRRVCSLAPLAAATRLAKATLKLLRSLRSRSESRPLATNATRLRKTPTDTRAKSQRLLEGAKSYRARPTSAA